MGSYSMKIAQHISKFRIQMIECLPFYGDIVMDLDFVEDSKVSTACTDGVKVYYNADFLAKKKAGEINYILMHEIMHIILCHPSRGKAFTSNREIFNVAADIVVNTILDSIRETFSKVSIDFSRPHDAITDRRVNRTSQGLNLENVYNEILEATNKTYGNKKTSSIVLSRYYGNEENLKDNKEKVIKTDDNPIFHDLFEKPSVGSDELGCPVEDYVKEILLHANENYQKQRGMMKSIPIPEILIELSEKPLLNWKRLLKDFLFEAEADDSSYATPERKYIHMDLILPGHCTREEEVGDVWAFVDTSGSVGMVELNMFITELYGIIKQFKNKLNVAFWDTSVTDVYKDIRTKEDLLKALPRSTGGTDINCVYQWIRDNKVKPEIMLILTDGMFGNLRAELKDNALKKKTIVVLSYDLQDKDNVEEVGKIASLI